MQEGQPPSEPQRLEDVDPAVLAEIEAEFAAISQEIQRISAMPRTSAPRKAELLSSIRADWKKRAETRAADRPDWRKRLDAALDSAIDKMLVDSLVDLPDGNVAFQLNPGTMQSEGPPLLRALLDGLLATWQEKLKPAPGQAPSPFAGIVASLGQVLTQAFAGVKVAPPEAGDGAAPPAPATKLELGLEQPIEAHIKLGTGRAPVVTVDAGAGPTTLSATAPDAAPTPTPEPAGAPTTPAPEAPTNDAGREFFAALMGGLGQMLQRSLAPTPASPAAPPAQPAPEPVAAAAPGAKPAEPAPTLEPTLELKQPNAPPDAPPASIKIDLQGLLGQLLSGLKQPPRK